MWWNKWISTKEGGVKNYTERNPEKKRKLDWTHSAKKYLLHYVVEGKIGGLKELARKKCLWLAQEDKIQGTKIEAQDQIAWK